MKPELAWPDMFRLGWASIERPTTIPMPPAGKVALYPNYMPRRKRRPNGTISHERTNRNR